MKLELHTIGVSHYCEKARWALERAGLPFTERAYAPLFHLQAKLFRGTGRSLPALITPHGKFLDSTDILRFVDRVCEPSARLFPDDASRGEVEELEAWFDDALGPQTRRWAYSFAIKDRALLARMMDRGLAPSQARLASAFRPLIVLGLIRGLRLGERAIERSQMRIAEVFEEVGARLRDGRPYLTGDRFTAADLTFAALGAPAVLPEGYGFGIPPLEELPEEMARAARGMRQTPAGELVLRLYRDHRRETLRG